MSVKIRLTRIGRHKEPIYRIVAADHKYARDGRYIEQVGYYDPKNGIKGATLEEEKVLKWLAQGAQYSDTIRAILKENGLLEKAKKEPTSHPKKAKVVSTASKSEKKVAKKPAAKKTTKKAAAKKKVVKEEAPVEAAPVEEGKAE